MWNSNLDLNLITTFHKLGLVTESNVFLLYIFESFQVQGFGEIIIHNCHWSDWVSTALSRKSIIRMCF